MDPLSKTVAAVRAAPPTAPRYSAPPPLRLAEPAAHRRLSSAAALAPLAASNAEQAAEPEEDEDDSGVHRRPSRRDFLEGLAAKIADLPDHPPRLAKAAALEAHPPPRVDIEIDLSELESGLREAAAAVDPTLPDRMAWIRDLLGARRELTVELSEESECTLYAERDPAKPQGIFLPQGSALLPGDVVYLDVRVIGAEPFRCAAICVWSAPHGVGVAPLGLGSDARHLLEGYAQARLPLFVAR